MIEAGQPPAGTCTGPSALQLLAIAVLAGAVLAFEIILLRLFEYSHWHHFAGLTIALALLGLGSAGTVLSLAGPRAGAFGDRWLLSGLLLAAAGLLIVLLLHARVSLRPVFAVWNPGELARLLLVDFAAFVPFFGAGLALGQVFPRWPAYPGRLYAANLVGSGIGSAGAALLLARVLPETSLALVAALLLAFGIFMALAKRHHAHALGAGLLLLPAAWMMLAPPTLSVSDFKALSRVLELPDARILKQQPGLPGRLTLVRSDSLRFAPGLSLDWTGAIPAADAAVIGSDRIVAVERAYRDPPPHFRATLAGLPLLLRPRGRVLVAGSGTWSTAAFAGDRPLTRVEPDRRIVQLEMNRGLAAEAIIDSPHRYLAVTGRNFRVIVLDAVYDGGDAASEAWLMTRQGLASALRALETDGLLAIPLQYHYPPRHWPRLLATVNSALLAAGSKDPGHHVLALRGLQVLLVMVSPAPFSGADTAFVNDFAEQWGFDLVWRRGLTTDQTNLRHVLDQPVFFETARAVFGNETLPDQARWFATGPATMSRPYFWQAMQWSNVTELIRMLGARSASYLDWTLIMSALALVVAALAAAILIIVPLGRMPAASGTIRRLQIAGYFGLLGFGFMLIEMAMLQRSVLFLELPVLAAAVVFTVFLIGAGIGSAMLPSAPVTRPVTRIFGALAAGAALAVSALWWPGAPLLALPAGLRITALALLLLPLCWAMGRPFPWGLGQISRTPVWLPWSWAINGFASVIAASLATLLSVHAGQPATLLAGCSCYLGAGLIAYRWQKYQ